MKNAESAQVHSRSALVTIALCALGTDTGLEGGLDSRSQEASVSESDQGANITLSQGRFFGSCPDPAQTQRKGYSSVRVRIPGANCAPFNSAGLPRQSTSPESDCGESEHASPRTATGPAGLARRACVG